MKTIYYHGTSADNLDSILKHGLSTSEGKIWSCSEDAVYLWDPKECAEVNDLDADEDGENEALRMAYESGQIACAIAKDCRIVVVKVEVDSDEVHCDTSCENMEGSGAKCIYRDIKPSEILEIKVSNDFSLLKGYFIGIIANRDYNNCDFTDLELQVSKLFEASCIYEEMDYLVKWETVKILQEA